jgi:Ran GTPase-activating protein (RanGAP) involved in mRNA processing and transport
VLQSANLEAQTEELDFSDNDVGVDVANAIGQGLQTSHTLTRLYLSGNGIGDRCVTAVALACWLHAQDGLVRLRNWTH